VSPSDARRAAALEAAARFVAGQGSRLARLRLAVLRGERPASELARAVESRQGPAGEVAPLETDGAADAASTAAALTLLGEHRLELAPCAERAAAWLVARQTPSGAFEPAPGAGERERLAFSGQLAARLTRIPSVPARALDAAAGFVAEGFSPERAGAGDLELLAAFLGLFTCCAHPSADAALQWCGRELERGFRAGRFDALGVARVFTLCDAQALPGARLGAQELVPALLAGQAGDGGFGGAAAGPAARVAATLDAALALVHLG
jgi:hypothetical protein